MPRAVFLSTPADCQWLRETHLREFSPPEFSSCLLIGNEDSPEELRLYKSADPLYTDEFSRVIFPEGVAVLEH